MSDVRSVDESAVRTCEVLVAEVGRVVVRVPTIFGGEQMSDRRVVPVAVVVVVVVVCVAVVVVIVVGAGLLAE